VLGLMLDRFGKEHAIAPTPLELSEVLAVLVQEAPKSDALVQRAPPDTTDPQVRSAANALVARFRIHEALWRIHGGRVLIDPRSGPLPFDSYRKLLEAEQKAGSFRLPAAWQKRFWSTFAEDSTRGFVSPEVATAAMTRPWWRPGGSPAAQH
jgi:hypothetical protein